MLAETPTNTCPRCGTSFTCGMQAGHEKCWCSAIPAMLPVPAGKVDPTASCYCPACLDAIRAARQA